MNESHRGEHSNARDAAWQPTTLEAIGSTTADPVVDAAVRWIETIDRP